MNIQFTGRHKKITDNMKDFFAQEIEGFEKFADDIHTVHVIVDEEHKENLVEVVVTLNQHKVTGKAMDENFGKAADAAIEKAEKQIKKIADKRKEKKL